MREGFEYNVQVVNSDLEQLPAGQMGDIVIKQPPLFILTATPTVMAHFSKLV